ncbi:aldehyde dehydrogenase [bacterium]|nr:aldehyde dehydrogenase [bacterium]
MIETHTELFIDGAWVTPATASTIDVVSPHTEAVIARVAEAREADVDRAVAAAHAAFDHGPWPRTPAAARGAAMRRLLAALQARSERLAQVITAEMGSPISFSTMGQVMAATLVLDYFARLAGEFAFEDVRQGMIGPTLVRREPVGVVAAITPWNVPLFTAMLKLGPALAAGCTVVLKPAPETPLDAVLLAEALVEAEIPPGVVNILPAGREVGDYLVRHAGIDKVSFTGSTAAGRHIAAVCGEQLKRVTLELGGKSAAIILDDADLDGTVAGLLPAMIMNNGQACVAQTRVLASRRRYREVAEALAAALGAVTVGDPADMATMCGPLVSARQRERVEGYIASGRAEGARVAVGGGRPASPSRGWYVEPTLFVDVDNRMRIAREEIFGPVIALIPYADEADALRIANESDYGLSGTVWTADVDRGLDVARRVRTGTYTVNNFMMEFGAPFGGFKCSGIGRELGPEGLGAYLEPKSINLPMGYEPRPSY